jgi:hypothetical protein
MEGEAAEPEPAGDRAKTWLELVSTVLLALATVATAWSGYQATRWSGAQAQAYSSANAARLESTRASNLANTQTSIDVATFIQWVDAYAHHNTALAAFYLDRLRPEFKPAVDAWIATKPLKNPDAPLTPFSMPQYRLAANVKAQRLDGVAAAQADLAKTDNQRGDNYVLAVVLFATSLFFAGISTRLATRRSEAAILGLGCVLFVGALIWLATFPVSVGV